MIKTISLFKEKKHKTNQRNFSQKNKERKKRKNEKYSIGYFSIGMSQPLDSAQTSPSSSSSPSPPMTHLFDTVVIGAGPSGLYAARHLRKQGLNVLVVEARNVRGKSQRTTERVRSDFTQRVGGRTKGEIHQGKYQFDVGGQWVGPTQDRLYGLIKEFG